MKTHLTIVANGNVEKQSNGNSNRSPVSQTSRLRSVTHPRYSLQQAEKLAKAAFDIGPRNCDQDKVAQKVSYKDASNGAFRSLRATASQFGLIVFNGSLLSVSEEWIEIFSADDPGLYRSARQEAMRRPDLYKQLMEDYSNRQLPAVEKLSQQLYINQKYGILKDAALIAAEVFYESAAYSEIVNEKGYIIQLSNEANSSIDIKEAIKKGTGSSSTKRDDKVESGGGQEHNVQNLPVHPILQMGNLAGLHKFEIPLVNGGMAYIFAPARMPFGEKERLKKFIDLMLDEPKPDIRKDDSLNSEFAPSTVAEPNL